ncbi:MAG: hypothetical protein QM754_01755 [Tepidisphaeraceae bacterium]
MKRPTRSPGTTFLVLAAAGVMAGLTLAEEPTTVPAVYETKVPAPKPAASTDRAQHVPTTRPTPFGNRVVRLSDLGLAGSDWPRLPVDQQPNQDEWQVVVEFAKENFPNRFKLFEELQASRGEDNQLVQTLRSRFFGRYRLLMRIQDRMRDLYDSAIKQGKLEDEAWGAVMAYRKKRNDPKLDAAMREKVSALVKNLLEERSDRLKRLQDAITEEQKQLEADQGNVDELVDRQIRVLSGDDPNFGRDGRGAGGGWGAWGGAGTPGPAGPGQNWGRGPGGPGGREGRDFRDGQRPPPQPSTRPRGD